MGPTTSNDVVNCTVSNSMSLFWSWFSVGQYNDDSQLSSMMLKPNMKLTLIGTRADVIVSHLYIFSPNQVDVHCDSDSHSHVHTHATNLDRVQSS